eukprot:11156440-Lingulodinium_polyedra.AAC.1
MASRENQICWSRAPRIKRNDCRSITWEKQDPNAGARTGWWQLRPNGAGRHGTPVYNANALVPHWQQRAWPNANRADIL